MLLNPLTRKNARCSCAKVITKNYDINWKKHKSFSNIICGVFNLLFDFENIPMPEYQIYDTISADGATYLWNQMLHEETK